MKNIVKITIVVLEFAFMFLFVCFHNSNTVYADEYTYDNNGRIIRVDHDDGSYTEYEYDRNGNIILTRTVESQDMNTDPPNIPDSNSENKNDNTNSVVKDSEGQGEKQQKPISEKTSDDSKHINENNSERKSEEKYNSEKKHEEYNKKNNEENIESNQSNNIENNTVIEDGNTSTGDMGINGVSLVFLSSMICIVLIRYQKQKNNK